jgi:hypothetical protein
MAEEEERPSASVRASATPAPAPRQRTQIKYDDYIKIHNMLLHRVNEDQSAAEDGVDEEDLLVWYLEQKESELQSQEDMETQKSLARKVLKKMVKVCPEHSPTSLTLSCADLSFADKCTSSDQRRRPCRRRWPGPAGREDHVCRTPELRG